MSHGIILSSFICVSSCHVTDGSHGLTQLWMRFSSDRNVKSLANCAAEIFLPKDLTTEERKGFNEFANSVQHVL